MTKSLCVLVLGFLLSPLCVCAQSTQSFDSAAIAKKVSPAVVLIKGTTGNEDALGTGFIISSDGKIATNLHVIRGLRSAGVQLASGDKFDSFDVLAFDERKDIAIIKIPGFDLPFVTLGNSNNVEVGEQVLAAGSPLGLQGSVTTGVISSVRDDPSGGGFKVLQTDAAANPGNSGGPLINGKSEVVGIIAFKLKNSENLNFAIPINYLRGLESSVAPISLDALRTKLSTVTDAFKSDAFPTRWKSLVSGSTKIIRRDGDRLYIETVLPDAQKSAGCFSLADLEKKNDIFAGVGRNGCICQYTKRLGIYAQTYTNRINFQYDFEISKLDSNRIEGRVKIFPKGTKLDCAKAKYSQPASEWEFFSWIPE